MEKTLFFIVISTAILTFTINTSENKMTPVELIMTNLSGNEVLSLQKYHIHLHLLAETSKIHGEFRTAPIAVATTNFSKEEQISFWITAFRKFPQFIKDAKQHMHDIKKENLTEILTAIEKYDD